MNCARISVQQNIIYLFYFAWGKVNFFRENAIVLKSYSLSMGRGACRLNEEKSGRNFFCHLKYLTPDQLAQFFSLFLANFMAKEF